MRDAREIPFAYREKLHSCVLVSGNWYVDQFEILVDVGIRENWRNESLAYEATNRK